MTTPPNPPGSPTPSTAASRRWNASRRRITLFLDRELSEGIEGVELRAIAYKAVYGYLAALKTSRDGSDPDAP